MMPQAEQHFALPEQLTSPRTKLVYLYLASAGEANATELVDAIGISKLALLPILQSLLTRNLVRRTEYGYAPQ